MNKESNKDEISELIDSIERDDTLERKMNAFKEKKAQKTRVQRLKERQESSHKQATQDDVSTPIVPPKIEPETIQEAQPDSSGVTMAWHPEDIKNDTDSNKTMVMDEGKIQSLMKEDTAQQKEENPMLHRQVVETKPKKVLKKKSEIDKLKQKRITKILLVVAGSLLLIFGVCNLVSYVLTESSSETTSGYDDLYDWASNYDQLSSSEKKEITSYEDTYNRLTRKEKEEIDSILEEKTGYNFNELLAKAQSSEKQNTKNNNVKNAEKRAKLKEEINSLQAKLDSAKSNLSSAQSKVDSISDEISTAEANNSKKVSSAESDLTSAQNDLYSIQSQIYSLVQPSESDYMDEDGEVDTAAYQAALATYKSELASLQTKEAAAQTKVNNAQSAYEKAASNTTDTSSLYTQLANAQAQVNEAQANVDSYSSQLSALQQEYDSLG